jgi:hypothetical protein
MCNLLACPFATSLLQGFRKVIKKHDKLTSSSLKETYWPLVEERYPEHKKEVLQQVGGHWLQVYVTDARAIRVFPEKARTKGPSGRCNPEHKKEMLQQVVGGRRKL